MTKVLERVHFSSAQIIIAGFATVILLGAALLTLPFASRVPGSANFADALFTATSAVCVTGLVVQDTALYWSEFGQAVILILIQIGGMGVVTVAVAIAMISGKKISLMQRSTMQEAISAHHVGGVVRLTGFIVRGSLLIELVGAMLLAIVFVPEFGVGQGVWYSVFHSISAFCNAGFDLMGVRAPYSSLVAYAGNPVVSLTIAGLIVVGGIGFLTWEDIRTNGLHLHAYRLQSKVILCVTFALIVLPAAYFYAFELSDALPVGERNILLLVCCKLLCAAAEPFVYEAVTAAFDCGGHTFTAKGKQVLSQGWRAIQEVFRSSLKEKPEDEDAEGVLPALTEGQVFEPVSASVTEHFTSPPKPYTEDTLLSAMENAGKEDMPDEAERKGLGTPATRAAIIEKLVSGGFVERKGKNLIPTKAGVNLVTVLPELLTSPKLTADWEQRLNEVAKGQASPEDFMDGIEAMAAELVRKYSHISEDGQKLFQPEKETVGLCPRCGKPVYEGKKNFACSDRACQFVMWKNDRFWTSRRKEMTRKMAADLLKKGRTSVKGMWSEKKGSTYDAVVILDDTGGKYVNFKLEFPKRKDGVHGKK